jgi:hypothetical protein
MPQNAYDMLAAKAARARGLPPDQAPSWRAPQIVKGCARWGAPCTCCLVRGGVDRVHSAARQRALGGLREEPGAVEALWPVLAGACRCGIGWDEL